MSAAPTHDSIVGDFIDSGKGIFTGGPPGHAEEWIGLGRPGNSRTLGRVAFCVLLGWLPLAVITAVQSGMLGDISLSSFISDVAVHVRSLLVVPLLVCAEDVILPRLNSIANQFVSSGVVRGESLRRFAQARASTIALRDAMSAEIVVIVLAYATTFAAMQLLPAFAYPAWQIMSWRDDTAFAPAGWWHICVSIPLLLVLLYGWFWRLFLWARFLVLTSRLDLHLVPSHPDRAAGLQFIGLSVSVFSVLAFAFGAIVAGTAANQVLRAGAAPPDLKYVALSVAVFSVALFCAPMLAFYLKLLRSWRAGFSSYGALARDVGERFEAKWLIAARRPTVAALEATDFSATTDLYSIAANVYAMRLVPISLASVGLLAAAAALPFLPVFLMTVSLPQLLERLVGLLF